VGLLTVPLAGPQQGVSRVTMQSALSLLSFMFACSDEAAVPQGEGPPPALVRTAEVTSGDLVEQWQAVGSVRALQAAELAAGASGPVASVTAREGDTVSAGQMLLELDAGPAAARWRAAQAAADEATVELDRLQAALARREAVADGVLAAEELQDARAGVARQQARVASLAPAAGEAATTLGRHTIRAPFDGVLTTRSVDPGDWVTAGQPVLALVSTGAVEVHTRVPQRVARRVEAGLAVQVSGNPGTVAAVVPAIDPASQTMLVRIRPDAGGSLVAGDAVDVRLPVSWDGAGVTVPRDALLLDPDQARVLRVDAGVATPVPVEVLATADAVALVQGTGLSVGDAVVTRGNERVRPGQAVRVEGAEAE